MRGDSERGKRGDGRQRGLRARIPPKRHGAASDVHREIHAGRVRTCPQSTISADGNHNWGTSEPGTRPGPPVPPGGLPAPCSSSRPTAPWARTGLLPHGTHGCSSRATGASTSPTTSTPDAPAAKRSPTCRPGPEPLRSPSRPREPLSSGAERAARLPALPGRDGRPGPVAAPLGLHAAVGDGSIIGVVRGATPGHLGNPPVSPIRLPALGVHPPWARCRPTVAQSRFSRRAVRGDRLRTPRTGRPGPAGSRGFAVHRPRARSRSGIVNSCSCMGTLLHQRRSPSLPIVGIHTDLVLRSSFSPGWFVLRSTRRE